MKKVRISQLGSFSSILGFHEKQLSKSFGGNTLESCKSQTY